MRQAIAAGDAETAPIAMVDLGGLLQLRGDAEGARALYQQAIDSGHAEAAPLAAASLGALLQARGDAEGS